MFSIELLSRAHDREGFDCGSQPLNAYFRQAARQHTERGISRTFVLVDEAGREPKPVLGFFTLNICQIRADQLSPELARKLPRDVAGIKLGRLAVSADQQRQGLGKMLLVAAMQKVIEVFESSIGCRPAWHGGTYHASVRIRRALCRELRLRFERMALRLGVGGLCRELRALDLEPYAPVRDQLRGILRAINRRRQAAGLETLPREAVGWRRTPVKPFE